MSHLTRIHILDANGISHEFFAEHWDLHHQDQGRTLKIIAAGTGGQAARAQRRRTNSLSQNLTDDLAVIRRVADAQRSRPAGTTPPDKA